MGDGVLVLFGGIVMGFGLFVIFRFLDIVRQSKEEADALKRWLEERKNYREGK